MTLVRWLSLQQNEILELERGEDIDIVRKELNGGVIDESRILEQVKRHGRGSLTLRNPEALEAIANFCVHRKENPDVQLRFRFVTTNPLGFERDWVRGDSALTLWESVRNGELGEGERIQAILAIRTFLKDCKPPKGSEAAWTCVEKLLVTDDVDALADVIQTFEWSTSSADSALLESEIRESLIVSGKAHTHSQAEQVYEHLFAFVFRCLAQPGLKRLSPEHVAQELRRPTISETERQLIQIIRRELRAFSYRLGNVEDSVAKADQQLAGLSETVVQMAKREGLSATINLQNPDISLGRPDLVSPVIPRVEATENLAHNLRTNRFVSLAGEPGSGKTQLALPPSTGFDYGRSLADYSTWFYGGAGVQYVRRLGSVRFVKPATTTVGELVPPSLPVDRTQSFGNR